MKLIALIFFYAMFIAAVVGLFTGCKESTEYQAVRVNGVICLLFEPSFWDSNRDIWCPDSTWIGKFDEGDGTS